MWDGQKLVAVTRDDVGPGFERSGIHADIGANIRVKLRDGKEVTARTGLSLLEEYLNASMTPEQVAQITGAPKSAVISLAEDIAKNPEATLFC